VAERASSDIEKNPPVPFGDLTTSPDGADAFPAPKGRVGTVAIGGVGRHPQRTSPFPG
jgi:hypothetical protein